MKDIAVIGSGYWGKNLVRNFNKLNALRVVCDLDFEMKVPEGVFFTTDYDSVLGDPEVHGVVIATPAETHANIAMQALEAGKDVFIEKPMAITVEDGERLVKYADENSRIILVGHVLEYHPAIMMLYELVKKGGLGDLRYIYSNRLNLGKFRTNENILWSFAPHDISIMLSLVGSMPVKVVTQMASYITPGIADLTVTGLEFDKGVKAHIFVSWLHPFKEQKLVVIGDNGMAVFNDMAKDKLVLYNHRVSYENKLPVPEAGDPVVIPIELDEPLKLECLDFIRAIKERRPPIIDGKKGLQVLQVLAMCQGGVK